MRLYYYHTRPIQEAYNEWLDHKHPGHILYGLTHFDKYGIECVFHNYKKEKSRIGFMCRNFIKIIFCKEKFDMIYATSFRGLEIIIFLRALGLYKKPLAIWHHTAITTSPNKLKNSISRFFYKGFDQIFFFSTKLIELSLDTGKVSKDKVHLIHWGADLNFYDRLLNEVSENKNIFISTGKENRDFPTLVEGFRDNKTSTLDLFVPKTNGNINYEKIFQNLSIPENIHLKVVGGIIPYEMAKEVANASYVAICCSNPPYSYTVGLTTLVEALALGKPVLCSDNPFWEMDIAGEGAGITIPYQDIDGWKKAIQFITENKKTADEMGKKGRALAERTYNLENYTKEIVDVLKAI